MQPGTYTVFCLQQRRRKISIPWGDSVGRWTTKRQRGDRGEWSTCGEDYWGAATRPVVYRPEYGDAPGYEKANEQRRAVRHATGLGGWLDLKFARRAKATAERLDNAGHYDSRDSGTGRTMQRVRHEFRILRVDLSYAEKVVQP
jgi:hypothetical protein